MLKESWSKNKHPAKVLIKVLIKCWTFNLFVYFVQLDKFLLNCIYCTNVEVKLRILLFGKLFLAVRVKIFHSPIWFTVFTTLKLPLSNWNTYLGGRELVKMQLLPRVFDLWRGRLLWTIHISWRGLRTTVWRALSYFDENCSVTA